MMMTRCCFAQQFGQNGNPVQIFGGLSPREFGECRINIHLTENQITDLVGLDLARPTHQIGNPQTTLIQVAFPTPEFNTRAGIQIGAKVASGMLVIPKPILPSVVAGEEYDGVVFQFQVAQQVEDRL